MENAKCNLGMNPEPFLKNTPLSLNCKKRVDTVLSIRLSFLDKVVLIIHIYFFELYVVLNTHGE